MLTEINTETRTMKKTAINFDEMFPYKAYFSLRQYSYVARLAKLARHGSMRRIVDGFFPQKWKEENDELIKKTRELGYKQWEFYPPALLRRMGIKGKRGRRRRMV